MRADTANNWTLELANESRESRNSLQTSDYYHYASAEQPARVRPLATEHHSSKNSPASLHSITLAVFLQQLKSLCQRQSYPRNKRALKHYLKFLLPPTIRQQLLNLALRESRIYTLIDLYLFELLLSPTVTVLVVQLIRPFFRHQFAITLRQLGNGLEHLAIDDTSWLDDRARLPSALATMTNLSTVSLRFLADDSMIAALGRHCHRLKEMDVSNSTGVTDSGIGALCYPHLPIDSLNGASSRKPGLDRVQSAKRTRKISAPAAVAAAAAAAVDNWPASGCMLWLPRLVLGGMRRRSFVQKQEDDAFCRSKSGSFDLPADDLNAGPASGINQSCIMSLRKLNVSGTGITTWSLQLISTVNPIITLRSS